MQKTKLATLAGSVLCGALLTQTATAANWFKLRGTEPGGTGHTLQVWGFLQPRYVDDQSDSISGVAPPPLQSLNGTLPAAGTLPRELKVQDSFSLRRARIGIRGTMVPINNDIDYFILTEWGQNGVTNGGNNSSLGSGGAQLLDASVTFNQLSRGLDDNGLNNLGARVRIGQFLFSQTSESLSHSTPGRRVHMFFPEITRINALRRRTFDNGDSNFPGNRAVNAARDTGIEIFDFAEFGNSDKPYEFTYSYALGNGDTIGEFNQDDNLRKHAWLSFAQLLDNTRGPRRHDWMVYAWWQDGDISFNDDVNNDGVSDNKQINPVGGFLNNSTPDGGFGKLVKNGNERDYNQTYTGVGFEYFDKPFPNLGQIRFNAEYQNMDGVTFDGANSPSADFVSGIRTAVDGQNEGFYVDVGYDINQHLGWKQRTTLNLRYDEFDRNKDDPARAVHGTNWTLTGEYFFHKKARLTVSYQTRDWDADDRTGVPKAVGNAILDDVGDRIGIEVTFIFKNVLLR